MPSLKALRGRIASVKSTQKITSAMKMVAASKLRRAQAQAEAARPYAAAHGADAGLARRQRGGQPDRAAAAGRHRPRPGAPADPGHRRPRPGRRVQRQCRPADPQHRPPAGEPKARRSRSSPSAARDATSCAASSPTDRRRRELRRPQVDRLRRRRGDRRPGHRHAGRRRVRCLHADLQPLPVGDLAGADRNAADPAAGAGRGGGAAGAGAVYDFEPDEDAILAPPAAAEPRGADLPRPAGQAPRASTARR